MPQRLALLALLGWVAGCGPGAPSTTPLAASAVPRVVEVAEPVANKPAPPIAVPNNLVKVLLVKQFQRMSECGHDGEVAKLHCGYTADGKLRPAASADTLRLFITEPPGVLAATSTWHPDSRMQDEPMVAECEFEPLGQMAAPRFAAQEGVPGWFYDGSMSVGRLSACVFEKAALPRLFDASHALLQYKGAMRAGPKVTRSRAEAQELAAELGKQVASGVAMAEVVAAYSDEPGAAKRQGALGRFRLNSMVSSFTWVLLTTPIGGTSPAFESDFGYHVLERHATP